MHAVGKKERSAADPAFEKRLSLYGIPPTQNVNLEDFQEYAQDRLKVLKEIDAASVRGIKGDALMQRIEEVVRKFLPLRNNFDGDIQKDVVSHFTLRLAYCRPNDRQWFIANETMLLRHRLKSAGDLTGFLMDNDMHFAAVDESTARVGDKANPARDNKSFERLKKGLHEFMRYRENNAMLAESTVHLRDFYCVPFEQALELVRIRRVFLWKGKALVWKKDIIAIVVSKFKQRLSQALATAYRWLPALKEDDRVYPFLNTLANQHITSDYKTDLSNRSIDIENLDQLTKQSFPPCMVHLHTNLRKSHHLKHGGRMQYGLYLKGIGLTLEQSLEFWRAEFVRTIPADRFAKEYTYNIRHNYGQEGRRADYTPYGCSKIINSMNPGNGDFHGCPFKTMDDKNLSDLLMRDMRLDTPAVRDVLETSHNHHYQIACRKVFEHSHKGCATDLAITHPNVYFDESRKYYEALAEGKDPKDRSKSAAGPAAKGTPATSAAPSTTPAPTDRKSVV
eukprot:TRINITY_DN15397_c0_g1_i1.p1 TRINITY_DN15397_c0_g1~~TRINITY_DN15397_c0_g1_i1.p1  ORF type:complete len:507 (-),score=115.25 TRINITY_DN15397_c0_g1_i1:87-1607(-)